MTPRRRRRILSLLAAALLAASVGWIFQATHALRNVELASVDARFDLRGKQDPPPDVVVVGVDSRTIAAGKNVYPINRKRYADVIDRLAKAGAGVIAVDVQFTEASDDEEADNALIEAVHSAPRVVLGTTEVADNGSTLIFGGGDGLAYSGATPANTNFKLDRDDRLRHMAGSIQKLTTFGVAAAKLLPGHRVSPPPGNSAMVDFPGPEGAVRTLSFLDVERGKVSAAAVRGKLVVVGVTADQGDDFHQTSTSDAMSGPEVQAAAAATALAGYPLHDASWVTNALLVLLLAVFAPLVALRLGHFGGLAATVVSLAAFALVAKLTFDGGTIIAVVPPVAAALTAGLAVVAVANPARSPWDRLLDLLTRGQKGNRRTRRVRASLLLGAALFISVAGLALQATHALSRLELSSVNQRFQIRGTQPVPNDVVLVAVDDKTFDEPPKPRWPFNRSDHAKVIRHLKAAGAKVIAFDIQISERNPDDPKGDQAMLDASRAAGNVVMATTETDDTGQVNVFFDPEDYAYSRATAANSNYLLDSDGRIRRSYFEITGLESFPLAAARLARPGLETPPGQNAWIDYVGPPNTVQRISYVDVRRGTFDPRLVKGKVVVIGGTAPSLQDLHSTSTTTGGLMPGPEVHANAIHTALAGFPLRSAASWINWLTVIALALITPFVALRRGITLPVAIGAATVAVFLVVAQLVFNSGTIIAVVYPLVAGVAAILATAAIHGLTVAFEREQARDAFARFVPEAVVDQVLADAEGVRLGGVRGEATVMFSDLRGFTSFSETLEPERVIESLNRYLTEMSEAILDHGGTLVAYMGDGIMAVFGAPLKQADHADRALEAARDMLGRMDGFNGWLREQGLHDGFKMGIGLNSGPVMSGNVGSERRLEYTALGDTTNTAARLEGMTKGTPHQLFISDTTKQTLTRPVDDLVAVGEAEVRGRKAKVLLWSLKDAPEAAQPAPPETTVEA